MSEQATVGIENAVFAEGSWHFRDRHPFWEGCDERPQVFSDADQEIEWPKVATASRVVGFAIAGVIFAVAMVSGALCWLLFASFGRADRQETPDEVDDGVANVQIEDELGRGYDAAQRAAYVHYLKYERQIGERILTSLFDEYQRMRSELPPGALPAVSSPADLRNLIRYHGMTVGPPAANGVCDLWFAFSWWADLEHGVGVRVRDGHVVSIGTMCDWDDDLGRTGFDG